MCALTAISIAALPACGGGNVDTSGGAVAPPVTPVTPVTPPVAPTTPTPVAQASINVATLGGAGQTATKVVTLPNGDSIAYFAAAAGNTAGTPQQAVVNADGKIVRVHYNNDGSVSRIVDEQTGSYLVVSPRTDGSGADYLLFDSSNAFVTGQALFFEAGQWKTATVLGDMGQVTGNLSGSAITGAFALKPTQLAYGPVTVLGAGTQTLLNASATPTTASLGARLLDLVVPSAYAQNVSTTDRSALFSGTVLATIGGFLAASAATTALPAAAALGGTLLIAAGASRIYSGLAGIQFSNLNTAFQQLENGVEAGTSASFAPGTTGTGGLLQHLRDAIAQAVANGLGSLPGAALRVVNQATALASGVTVPSFLADTTPSSYTLPAQALGSTVLSGSAVDSTGRVFNATGLVDSSGTVTATATSADGQRLAFSGTVAAPVNGTSTVSGTVSYTVAGTTTTATFSGATRPLGACAALTESGGQGTFSYVISLGRSAGTFDISYQMYSIPDGMTVILGGQTVFTTGGLVSNGGGSSVTFAGSDTAVVNMFAPNSGTAWDFTVSCAR